VADKNARRVAELEAALRTIAALATGADGARHQFKEIEATARDALGQKHHLTALGYGPKSRLS
jgi:hypothetical protein